eukprot:UN33282
MGAGTSIDGFWKFWRMHHTQEVYRLLEDYRIGNIQESERGLWKNVKVPYALDPERDERLWVHSKAPFIAETPNDLLHEYYTPNELFYVRHHNPVPVIDGDKYILSITGIGINNVNNNENDKNEEDSDEDEEEDEPEITLTLEDIKKFPKHEVDCILQCGGNRRFHLAKIAPIKGSKWKVGAISNAKWGGARLVDVLEYIGFNEHSEDGKAAKHIHFEGLDWGVDAPYGASLPIEKCTDPRKDVILAYEMNGVPIPRDHGYPIRVIAPGVVGARNVKWVGRMEISNEEYEGHYQRKAYKVFLPVKGGIT